MVGAVEQRRWGLVLIAVVLLGVFVTSNLRPRVITGVPRAEPVPDPPAVGDCVNTPFDEMVQVVDPDGSTEEQVLDIGACAEVRYGEVALVIDHPDHPRPGTGNEYDNENDCWAAASEYLGIKDPSDDPATGHPWVPVLLNGGTLAGPDRRQRSAGQDWIACVVYPRRAFGTSTDDGWDDQTTASYRRTLRDAVDTGVQRDRLGICTDDYLDTWTACDGSHRRQFIATSAIADEPVNRTSLQRSCADQIRLLTGVVDLSLDDELGAHIEVTGDEGEPIDDAVVPAGSGVTCLLESTGSRMLGGGMIGLGERPIPWA